QLAQGLRPGLLYCRRFVAKLADIMRIFWTIATLLLAAMPLLAQDDAPSGPFAGGGGGAQVFTRVDSVNPMEQVKAFLTKASITLNADQERTLRPAVEDAMKQLQEINDRFAARGEHRGGDERCGDRGDGGGIAALADGPAA